MISEETLTFLKNLERNNNRDWFQANKKSFEAAQDDLIRLAAFLISEVSKFDPEISGLDPKSCVFRIYRDIRFSKDKSPYKTNMGAYISPGGRKSMAPGYYVHIQPGQSFIAGGKYMPNSGELLSLRRAVAADTKGLRKIIREKKFVEYFGEIRGEKLKTAPKGFPADHEAVEYLKLKTFIAYHELHDDTFLVSDEFPKFVVNVFKAMKPLNDFLRAALSK